MSTRADNCLRLMPLHAKLTRIKMLEQMRITMRLLARGFFCPRGGMEGRVKLRCYVVASIVLVVAETTLKLRLYSAIRCGMLFSLLHSLFVAFYSYRKMPLQNDTYLSIHIIAFLCTLSSFFGLHAVYHGIGAASFLILFSSQTLVSFILTLSLTREGFTLLQLVGLLAVLVGCSVEVARMSMKKSYRPAVLFTLLSAFFAASASALFEVRIKPRIRSMWSFMLVFSTSSALFSLVLMAHEAYMFRDAYPKALASLCFYMLVATSFALSYITSKVSVLIDVSERNTLINVSMAAGYMAAEILVCNNGIDLVPLLCFSMAVIGVQMYNFFTVE
jgi:drug/metabolite transporter (DMT)-like permease